jgi:hypothetical protein
MDIARNIKYNLFVELKRELSKYLGRDHKNEDLDHTLEINNFKDSEGKNLKIALHLGRNARLVTLRSLTNPSVHVNFDVISPIGSDFSPDDKLFTALDFIFKLVPEDFKSIEPYTNAQVDLIPVTGLKRLVQTKQSNVSITLPQSGDFLIHIGDNKEVICKKNQIDSKNDQKFNQRFGFSIFNGFFRPVENHGLTTSTAPEESELGRYVHMPQRL